MHIICIYYRCASYEYPDLVGAFPSAMGKDAYKPVDGKREPASKHSPSLEDELGSDGLAVLNSGQVYT